MEKKNNLPDASGPVMQLTGSTPVPFGDLLIPEHNGKTNFMEWLMRAEMLC